MDIINTVAKKIADGIRLSDEDALALFESPELVEIGRLADDVNRKKNHDTVFFNVNRHINPTNICALSCKFCAYSRKPGEEGAYAYSIEEMVKKAGEAVEQGATEVHMVGGLHPRWRLDHYKDMIAAVKTAYPQIHIKAFTAVELDWFARRARKTVEEILVELQAVGLGSLPGGGAEIFDPEVRDAICETKVTAEQWIDTHRTAHRLGMHTNCTMLYGHIEKYHHRVDHMRRLRALQDETHGFNAFIPLAFQPMDNDMGIDRYTFGYDDLKTLAVARLYLDNFRHVKAYWIMLGQDIAQLGTQFGANDLDGTVIEEKIARMAGSRSGMVMTRSFIENIVLKAKRTPCERDTLYNPIGEGKVRQGASAARPGSELVRPALTKASYGEPLSHDDLLLLAQHATLHELGRLANQTPNRQSRGGEASFTPTVTLNLDSVASVGDAVERIEAAVESCRAAHQMRPSTLAIDVASKDGVHPEGRDLGFLLELVFACRHRFAELELAVWGLKGLWSMAQDENATVSELLAQLKEAGVDCIESSPRETETDLTHKEIAALHRQIHAADLVTVGKVELMAPTHGPGEPLWDSFLRRITAFSDTAIETGGLAGINIEASAGSFVTATEYLRAVALARIAARGVPLIVAPLALIPTLSPASANKAIMQHPAEKIASLCLHYGAGDVGPIDVATLSPLSVMKQIRAAGMRPVLREAGSLGLSGRAAPGGYEADLRHVPELPTVG